MNASQIRALTHEIAPVSLPDSSLLLQSFITSGKHIILLPMNPTLQHSTLTREERSTWNDRLHHSIKSLPWQIHSIAFPTTLPPHWSPLRFRWVVPRPSKVHRDMRAKQCLVDRIARLTTRNPVSQASLLVSQPKTFSITKIRLLNLKHHQDDPLCPSWGQTLPLLRCGERPFDQAPYLLANPKLRGP